MTTTSLLIVGLTRGGAWARDIARTTDLELAGLVEIRADPFNPSWNTSGRAFGYSMRATLADGTHVHYLTRRALARPQTTWYGDLWIVGEEGALFWNGVGPTFTLSRTLPSENYRDHHLATGPVGFVNREGVASAAGPVGQPNRQGGTSTTIVMVRELVAAMREGRPHPCDVDDNWVSFATAMAAVESAEMGQAVKVATE